jgi:hypothetical protein
MLKRDERYELVKPMLEIGKIKSFQDIFKFVPKTIVAADLGTKVDRLTKLMKRIEKFTLEDIFTIARYCELSVHEILVLVEAEYLQNKDRIKKTAFPYEPGNSTLSNNSSQSEKLS